MGLAKQWTAHAAVLLLLLAAAIGAVKLFDASTDVIRAVPVIYSFYFAVSLIVYGMKKNRGRRKKRI